MAGEALELKYRPNSIENYLGDTLRKKMKNIFANEDKFPQRLLIYGNKGCGKTTLARIISKEYLCTHRVDGHACGKCEACKDIEENLMYAPAGSSAICVQEINIATDGGKQKITNLLEDVMEGPMFPFKRKIYILDECHMLTNAAQNALLKVLEEPPEYAVFILCTTNPEGLLGTVKDTCQEKLEVKRANLDELVNRLEYICKEEKFTTSREALTFIANSNDRNPRSSLISLDSIARTYNGVVTLKEVTKELTKVESEIYIEYYSAANKSLEDILRFTGTLSDKDIDPVDFISGLTKFTMNCMYVRYGIGIEKFTKGFIESAKTFFKSYTTEDLDTLLQIVEYANKMINPSNGELIVATTAMRIGKVKLLAVGLQNEAEEAIKETERGNKKAVKILHEEQENNKVKNTVLNNALIASTFGKPVAEIKAGVQIGITDNVENDKEEQMGISEEELMSLFGSN